MAKTDAMQRGRLAMDTRDAAAAVAGVPRPRRPGDRRGARRPTRSRSTPTSAARERPKPPTKRTLTFDPATGNIIDDDLPRDRSQAAPAVHLPSDPEHDELVFENAALPEEGRRRQRRAVPPVLRLQAVGTPPRAAEPPAPDPPLTRPRRRRAWRGSTSPSPLARPVRRTARTACNIEDQITVRHADPNLDRPRSDVRMTRRLNLAASTATRCRVMHGHARDEHARRRDVRRRRRRHPVRPRVPGPQAGVRGRRGRASSTTSTS